MIGGDKRPAAFNMSGASRIVAATRWVETQPRSLPGTKRDAPSSRPANLQQAKVTAITPTSSAPPLKYTIQFGHWSAPTSSSPGTWVDDSGGTDSFAWPESIDNVPALVGAYVTVISRGSDASTPPVPYYSILGSPGTFAVYLTQSGGADSTDAGSPATYTYDVFLDSAKTIKIGVAISVDFARPIPASVAIATRGIATIMTGTVVLLMAAEYANVNTCSSGTSVNGGGP